MLRSFYIASTGMLAQRQKMDVMTNNITNIETIGYKKDKVLTRSFKDMLIETTKNSNNFDSKVGPLNTGIHTDKVVTSFEQGPVEATERISDVALEGNGFFVVNTPQGERYTRDGSFGVNSMGYLVNSDGFYVSGENGRINVGNSEFTIDENGGVFINEQMIDSLKVVEFDDLSALRKQGSNLFANTGAQARNAEETKVRQGYLENSNVNMTQEIISIMSVSRAYETNQQVVKMLDASLQKTVNEVGRI